MKKELSRKRTFFIIVAIILAIISAWGTHYFITFLKETVNDTTFYINAIEKDGKRFDQNGNRIMEENARVQNVIYMHNSNFFQVEEKDIGTFKAVNTCEEYKQAMEGQTFKDTVVFILSMLSLVSVLVIISYIRGNPRLSIMLFLLFVIPFSKMVYNLELGVIPYVDISEIGDIVAKQEQFNDVLLNNRIYRIDENYKNKVNIYVDGKIYDTNEQKIIEKSHFIEVSKYKAEDYNKKIQMMKEKQIVTFFIAFVLSIILIFLLILII